MGATPEVVVACGDALGEGALWHPDERALYWLDLRDPKLRRFDPATGETRTVGIAADPPLGTIALTDRPAVLLLAHRPGLSLLGARTGALTHLAAPDGRAGIVHNDGKVDRQGCLWAGTSDEAETEPRGALWRIAPGQPPALADSGFAVANGPAFSPDGGVMYFSDSNGRRILAYDVEPDGRLANRRLFAAMSEEEGFPDGLTVDAEGGLWVAHWDGWRVTRFTPDGARTATIPLPVPRVTSLAFGGADFSTLFVTTAAMDLTPDMLRQAPHSGHLFALEPGVPGLPERPFPIGSSPAI